MRKPDTEIPNERIAHLAYFLKSKTDSKKIVSKITKILRAITGINENVCLTTNYFAQRNAKIITALLKIISFEKSSDKVRLRKMALDEIFLSIEISFYT